MNGLGHISRPKDKVEIMYKHSGGADCGHFMLQCHRKLPSASGSSLSSGALSRGGSCKISSWLKTRLVLAIMTGEGGGLCGQNTATEAATETPKFRT